MRQDKVLKLGWRIRITIILESWIRIRIILGSWIQIRVILGSWIRIRKILGSWIRIRIEVKSWIRIRIEGKSWIRIRIEVKKLGALEAPWRAVDAHKWRRDGSKWSPGESADQWFRFVSL